MQEMQDTLFWNLGREDPLELEMATCSITLAWKIPWTEEPGGLRCMGSQKFDMTEWLTLFRLMPMTSQCYMHNYFYQFVKMPSAEKYFLKILHKKVITESFKLPELIAINH